MSNNKKTYAVSAYNIKTQMNEIQPTTFTDKSKAISYAEKICRLGARNVEVICDQTKEVTAINIMDTEYTIHTAELLAEAKEATGLAIEIHYWNNQHHVMINGRHCFAADETNCQSYLMGIIATSKRQML